MAHPMQPDPVSETDTYALLVHGWKCSVSFGANTMAQLAALQHAVEPAGAVFVVAQCLAYVDGPQDVVIGLPLASAHANTGPVEWSIDEARAVAARTASAFSSSVLETLTQLVDVAPTGAPRWLLVPTGPLASGYVAYGDLIDTPKHRDAKDASLTVGGDTSQRAHAKAVRGERLAHANDWDVVEVDLSPARIDELRARGDGRFHVIARFD
jgi:hypothetical protein